MRLTRKIASIVVLAQLMLGGTVGQSCAHSADAAAAGEHHAPAGDFETPPEGSSSSTCEHELMPGCATSGSCGAVPDVDRATLSRGASEERATPGGYLLANREHFPRLEPPPPRA